MMLSFSEPGMLPYVRAGIRQAAGEDVGGERVKRQTIRRRGPRAEQLLAHDPIAGTTPYIFNLYWKARTPQCEHLGDVSCVRVVAIEILHSRVEPTDRAPYQSLRICGRRHWNDDGDDTLFWAHGDADSGFCRFAFNDGFETVEAFREYFVPNFGDRFEAILYRW